jgi:thioredoxin-like negative regulator of GroEL
LIESRRGRLPDAIAHLKKAVTLDRGNLKALYALAQETERQAAPDSDAQAEKLFAQILERQPGNLAALLDVARLAAKLGDGATLQKTVSSIAQESAAWPDEVRQRFTTLQQAAAEHAGTRTHVPSESGCRQDPRGVRRRAFPEVSQTACAGLGTRSPRYGDHV